MLFIQYHPEVMPLVLTAALAPRLLHCLSVFGATSNLDTHIVAHLEHNAHWYTCAQATAGASTVTDSSD
jgi:hypothetical protein